MRRVVPLLVVAAFAVVPLASMAADNQSVAVVELENQSKRVTIDEVQFITDMVRKAARDGLDPTRYSVMTRETMEVLVPPSEMKCLAGKCLVEIGKKLQAKYVVGGGVKDFGKSIAITLEAYESKTGMLTGSETGRAASIDEAGSLVEQMAARLIRQVIGGSAPQPSSRAAPEIGQRSGAETAPVPEVTATGPRVKKGGVTEVVGELTVSAKASDGSAVRLDLTDPSGAKAASSTPYKNNQAKVGRWRVVASATNHEDAEQTFDVPPDEPTLVKLELKRLGDLTVTATAQDGAAVRMDIVDPSGSKTASGSPYRNPAAKVGTWHVTARASGQADVEQAFTVPYRDPTVIKLELKSLGALKVTGEPAGAAVKVTGPGGFRDDGGLPWEAEGLRSGTYRIEVSRTGYETNSRNVLVEPGQTATSAVHLTKKAMSGGEPVRTSIPSGRPGKKPPVDHEKVRELIMAGHYACNNDDFPGAIRAYENALELDDSNTVVRRLLEQAVKRSCQTEDKEQAKEQAVKKIVQTEDADALSNRVRAEQARKAALAEESLPDKLPMGQINSIMRKKQGEVARCVMASGATKGDIIRPVVQFTIRSSGLVESVSVGGAGAAEPCILNVVKSVRFPPSKPDSELVTYPYVVQM